MGIVRAVISAVAFGVAAPAAAQIGPTKLVILYYQSVAVVDYPNGSRCERAAKVINDMMSARAVASGLPAESGRIAFCIPG